MKLIHVCRKEELDKQLAQTGCYQTGAFIHFCTWNSLPLVFHEPLSEEEVCLQISSDAKNIDIRWEKSASGIDYPHVYGGLEPSQFQVVSADQFHRVNILMNTSIIDDAWCYPALKKYLHSGDVVCVLAFSFFDDTKNLDDWNRQYAKGRGIWYKANTDVFRRFGIPEKDVHWVNYFTDSREEMLNAIANSNVLLLTGGAPDLMMKRIKEKRLKKILKTYQGVVIGYSAGAMVQLSDYHISPDEDYPSFSWQKGLGMLEGFDIEVHYAATPHQKRWLEKARQDRNMKTYAIYEKGGMIVENEKISFFGQVDEDPVG